MIRQDPRVVPERPPAFPEGEIPAPVRIHRVDVDGFGRLAGSFRFPAEGLGVWPGPNESGKSTLAAAVVAALYGAPSEEDEKPGGWIMLRFARDDGTTLVVARDLATDRVQVTDPGGRDVTSSYRDAERGVEIGKSLFGLDRAQFAEVFLVRPEDLPNTVGNPTLLRLLRRGTDAEPGQCESPVNEEARAPLPEGTAGEAPPRTATSGDLPIVRSAAEQMQVFGSGDAEPSGTASTGGMELDPDLSDEGEPEMPGEDPDAPGLSPIERLRRLRQRLTRLDERETAKRAELVSLSERSRELQSEARRLAALSGAEPHDIERLREIVDRTSEMRERQDRLARDEAAYRRALEEHEVPVEEIQQSAALFDSLSEPQREFLAGYRQEESVRRGTRALTRSESRLDEARLQEISRAREQAVRTAVLPLVASAVGLFGWLATLFVRVPAFAAPLLVALGVAGALAGGILFGRGLRLRESERRELAASRERKQAQLEEVDREEQAAIERLEALATDAKLGSAGAALERWEQWTAHAEELRALDDFARRRRELDHTAAALRDQLGRFAVAEPGADPSDTTLLDADAMMRDYRRFFELRTELEAADARGSDLEGALAALESERAELRERIESILLDAGVDPERELDEAIEIFALRRERGSGVGTLHTIAAEDRSVPDMLAQAQSWTSPLSARMEAILRRFLPEACDVEVDASLAPRMRLQDSGPLLGIAQLARTLSGASLDQVCLALRLAIVETLGSTGERIPVFLDDPLVRADDLRHERALEFLVEDASERGQVVLLTAQEVRIKWFLHQFPQHRAHLTSLLPPATGARARASSASVPSPVS